MNRKQSRSDMKVGIAFAIGCGAGVGGATLLGSCFAWLSGAFWNGMWMIVVMHAIFAMVLMGAWLAPTLLCLEEE